MAALFYGQARASGEDVSKLSEVLGIPTAPLEAELAGFPDRGRTVELPPKEPLIYRLFEIIQNYGYAYKAVLNEKFGDGIMSAVTFSTKVDKETDDTGDWVLITLRGKWCVGPRRGRAVGMAFTDAVRVRRPGCRTRASRRRRAYRLQPWPGGLGVRCSMYLHVHSGRAIWGTSEMDVQLRRQVTAPTA